MSSSWLQTIRHATFKVLTCFIYQLNAQLFYSITIYMLHYNPRHVSNINVPIFRRTNFIITASGIVTLCTVQYSMPEESRLLCSKHVEDYNVIYILL